MEGAARVGGTPALSWRWHAVISRRRAKAFFDSGEILVLMRRRDSVGCIGGGCPTPSVIWACTSSGSVRLHDVLHATDAVLAGSGPSGVGSWGGALREAGVPPRARCIAPMAGGRVLTGHEDGTLCVTEAIDASAMDSAASALSACRPTLLRPDSGGGGGGAGAAAVVSVVAVGATELWTGDKAGQLRAWSIRPELCGGGGGPKGGVAAPGPLGSDDHASSSAWVCRALCLLDGSSGHRRPLTGLAAAHGARGVVWSCSTDATRVWNTCAPSLLSGCLTPRLPAVLPSSSSSSSSYLDSGGCSPVAVSLRGDWCTARHISMAHL
jgi:hypothetical protein